MPARRRCSTKRRCPGRGHHRQATGLPAAARRAGGSAACHRAGRDAIEADHGRLKARLRPMRGLKRPSLGAYRRHRARLRAEPAARPLRDHGRPTGLRPGARRVRRTCVIPLTGGANCAHARSCHAAPGTRQQHPRRQVRPRRDRGHRDLLTAYGPARAGRSAHHRLGCTRALTGAGSPWRRYTSWAAVWCLDRIQDSARRCVTVSTR